jgi:hypothetical protein
MNKILYDENKTGTLIVSCFRTGSHFLAKVIKDSVRNGHYTTQSVEIGSSNTEIDFDALEKLPNYKICIINSYYPKFHLTHKVLTDKWYVIHLTRRDKVNQFISDWVWMQNSFDQPFNGGRYKHHAGIAAEYEHLKNNKVRCEVERVISWLKDSLINYHLPCHTTIDYSELPSYQTADTPWQPNEYNLQLKDLFINYTEIENLLNNYKL